MTASQPEPLDSDIELATAFQAQHGGTFAIDPDGAACVYHFGNSRFSHIFATRWLRGEQQRTPYELAAANDNHPACSTGIRATPFRWPDEATFPRRESLYGSDYIRKYLTATAGAGGGGKSSLVISEALAMVSGRPLLGESKSKPLRVWYINLEDPIEEIERRFLAAAKHFKVTPDQCGERLFTDSGRGQSFVVMEADGRGTKVMEPIVAGIVAELKARHIDVLILDPFVSTHHVDENDNSKIQRVAEQWVRVAEEADCAVKVVHHVVKRADGDYTADSMRGAGALKDKARKVRVLNPMTEKLAGEMRINPEDADLYFRATDGKTNMGRRGRQHWYRFQPVRLANGGTGDLAAGNGDEVGVVVAWEQQQDVAARAEAEVAQLAEEELQVILVGIQNGERRRLNWQSKDWAGLEVAYALGLDVSGGGFTDQKRQADRVLKALIAAGFLVTEMQDDPVAKRKIPLVNVAER